MVGPGQATCELRATFAAVWGSQGVCHGWQMQYKWRCGYRQDCWEQTVPVWDGGPWAAACELCATFAAVQGSQGVCHEWRTQYK